MFRSRVTEYDVIYSLHDVVLEEFLASGLGLGAKTMQVPERLNKTLKTIISQHSMAGSMQSHLGLDSVFERLFVVEQPQFFVCGESAKLQPRAALNPKVPQSFRPFTALQRRHKDLLQGFIQHLYDDDGLNEKIANLQSCAHSSTQRFKINPAIKKELKKKLSPEDFKSITSDGNLNREVRGPMPRLPIPVTASKKNELAARALKRRRESGQSSNNNDEKDVDNANNNNNDDEKDVDNDNDNTHDNKANDTNNDKYNSNANKKPRKAARKPRTAAGNRIKRTDVYVPE